MAATAEHVRADTIERAAGEQSRLDKGFGDRLNRLDKPKSN